MAVTIRDLAEKLNLSITTVSRALDGYDDVAEETRKRVISAAKDLGYQPSFAARQLRRKRLDAIGFILPTASPQFTDPFYTRFLAGLCDEASSRGQDLVVTSSPPESAQEMSQYRQWAQSRRVDGFIINRTRLNDWRIAYLQDAKIPFVSLGKSESTETYPHVWVDERGALRKLIRLLAQKGHWRIAYIGAPDNLALQSERFGGYLEGLKQAGIPYQDELCVAGDLSEQGGYDATTQLLRLANPPSAIVTCNDLTALGAMEAAKQGGYNIGSELAIAGYDGIQEAAYTSPPLTTIHQPTYEIARTLVEMLLWKIHGENHRENQVVVEPTLIMRASTG
jgi:LacI family transcriptional regulator